MVDSHKNLVVPKRFNVKSGWYNQIYAWTISFFPCTRILEIKEEFSMYERNSDIGFLLLLRNLLANGNAVGRRHAVSV